MFPLENSYQDILKKLGNFCQKANRSASDVLLLAVSKKQSAENIRTLWHLGQRHFAENQVQEALKKQTQLRDLSIIWHFIGPIQTNKARQIAQNFDWVHSLCRKEEASKLNHYRALLPEALPLKIALQVNIGCEAQKNGLAPTEVLPLAHWIQEHCPYLALEGIMCIPPVTLDFNTQCFYFGQMLPLQQQLREAGCQCDMLSMGMTDDLEAAILMGSTCVRVGRGLFGDRS